MKLDLLSEVREYIYDQKGVVVQKELVVLEKFLDGRRREIKH